MDRLEKLAMPALAATEEVPDRVPPPGLVPIATVTVAVELVTVLPNASCTVTCTAGEMLVPAVALLGCTVKATRFAAAALTVWTWVGFVSPEPLVRRMVGVPTLVSV